jgi:hypothetical protein
MVSAAILSHPALSLIEQPHDLSDLRSGVSAAEAPVAAKISTPKRKSKKSLHRGIVL